ncbi:MAG: PmoA family protein, partial [Verrucomicrobiota bacterium]|nr:PmoA family protein [Verrucomicrobiota bacterium]
MKSFTRLFIVAALVGHAFHSQAGDFSVETTKAGVTVKYEGTLFTLYVIGQSNKPFMWPIIGPNGNEVTRAFPMEKREGERHDHPHHRSLWFGHQGIGGFDTWHEPASGRKTSLGSTVHRKFVKVQGGETAVIVTRNDYVGGGKKLLADERTHIFKVENGQRIIDVNITFTAEYGDCVLGDKKDAGFSVRIATSMDVDSKKGGSIVNSNGITDKTAWGKRAE